MYIPPAGSRSFFLDVLSALNLAGAGGALLRTAVLATLEVMISTRIAQAQGFAMAVPDQYITPVTETPTGMQELSVNEATAPSRLQKP
jgi:hypothetical protein